MLGRVRPGLLVLSNLAGPIHLFFNLRFLMLGGTRLLQTFVLKKVLGAVRFWILLVVHSSLTLPMFGREIRLCSEVSWWVVFGTVSCW